MVGGFRHKEAHAQPQVTANEGIRVSFERGPTAITVSFAMNSQWASSKTPCRRAGLAVTRLRVRVLAPCAALPLVALTWRTPPHARPCSLPPSRPLWLRPASRRLVRRGIDLAAVLFPARGGQFLFSIFRYHDSLARPILTLAAPRRPGWCAPIRNSSPAQSARPARPQTGLVWPAARRLACAAAISDVQAATASGSAAI